MRRNGILALCLLTILVFSTPARAELSLSFVGAAADNLTNHADSSGETVQGRSGFGGGALLDFHLVPRLALETGGIYMATGYHLVSGSTTSVTRDSIYIPADLRWFFGYRFSLSGGAYYNLSTESGDPTDYGWEAGLRFMMSRRWFIEGRYSKGLKDLGDGLHYSNVIGLLGFRLGRL
jgi:hypothetical protein